MLRRRSSTHVGDSATGDVLKLRFLFVSRYLFCRLAAPEMLCMALFDIEQRRIWDENNTTPASRDIEKVQESTIYFFDAGQDRFCKY